MLYAIISLHLGMHTANFEIIPFTFYWLYPPILLFYILFIVKDVFRRGLFNHLCLGILLLHFVYRILLPFHDNENIIFM